MNQQQIQHKKWSAAEEKQLLDELNDPLFDIDNVARNHGRNPGGIKIRIRKLAVEAIERSPEKKAEILKQFNLSEEDISQHKKLLSQKEAGITTDKGRWDKIKWHLAEINKLI